MQGICKFGFYELFKNVYSGIIGEENTFLYRTSLYLAASASAEFFADIALSPMESAKVMFNKTSNKCVAIHYYNEHCINFPSKYLINWMFEIR